MVASLVGCAVEHAAVHRSEKLGQPISFKTMFERIEAKDEDASERADIIQTLYAIKGRDNFTAISLHEHLAESARRFRNWLCRSAPEPSSCASLLRQTR